MKQNFLLVLVDQLPYSALPTYGNTNVKTPNIDRIAKDSVKFDSCYTACPMCQPGRAAFWTGLYPHINTVRANGQKPPTSIREDITTIGQTFLDNGYETMHFGKQKDAGSLKGFTLEPHDRMDIDDALDGYPLTNDSLADRYTRVKAVEYLENRDNDKPLFMVADFVNPHNICEWCGIYRNDTENEFITENLPELPINFKVSDMKTRPTAVRYICCTNPRQTQAVGWTDFKYRQYLSAYYHYISRVDAEIGHVLDALEAKGLASDTTIVFMADHGDNMTARKQVIKHVCFYEEVMRVPFIFSGVNVKAKDTVVSNLTSTLDLLPTLCGLAGINVPSDLSGKDLTPILQGTGDVTRDYVVSEWHTEGGDSISPGRMIRNNQYKYIRYIENNDTEMYDLINDPYEMKNLIPFEEFKEIAKEMEALLQAHMKETGDDFDSLEIDVDPVKFRTFPVGHEE